MVVLQGNWTWFESKESGSHADGAGGKKSWLNTTYERMEEKVWVESGRSDKCLVSVG